MITKKDTIDWENIDWDSLTPIQKRQLNYPEVSDKDIGHLYDIVTALIDTLSANGIDIPIADNDREYIEYRKLIKARIPKN